MRKILQITLLSMLLLVASCGGNDDTIVTPTPAEIPGETFPVLIGLGTAGLSVDENSANDTEIGQVTITVTNSTETPVLAIEKQTPEGAIYIDSSGVIKVLDGTKLDYEANSEITATISATIGDVSSELDITIEVNDVSEDAPFVTTWQTTSANESIIIYTNSTDFTYNYNVDWGDGNTSLLQAGDVTHSYEVAGTYTVKISGDFPTFSVVGVNDFNNASKLKSVESWGDNEWLSMRNMFSRASNLEIVATDVPDLSEVIDMGGMFSFTTDFNSDISNWDVGHVVNMESMFRLATSFNQDIGSWRVDSVTNMDSMFSNASDFNQDIGSWDVGAVTNMEFMFSGASPFSQDLSDWDTANVTNCNSFSSNSSLTNAQLPTLGCFAPVQAIKN